MIYNNTQELIELLKKNNIWAKKGLGQNFLVNPQVLEKILEVADIKKDEFIVEIGPGLGVLTAELAQRANKVRTIEVDPDIIPIFQKNIAGLNNIELEEGNALKAKLPSEPYKLIANIPYYITSPLINHFLQPQTVQEKQPSLIVLLVQKEVAEKICVEAGEHTVLSLQVQIFGKPSIAGIVSKTSFYPQPKVDSAILKIAVYPKPFVSDIELFLSLIKKLFAQRRKTLLNSLQNQLKMEKQQAEEALQKAHIEPNRRPQTLTLKEWQDLMVAIPG